MDLTGIEKEQAWAVQNILEPGWHNVRITEAKESQSKQGNPQIELDLESLTGDGNIKDWIVVVPQTLGKVRQLLDSAGVQIKSGDWADFSPEMLAGSEVSVLVRTEEKYGEPGKTINRVVGYEMPRVGAAVGNGSTSDASIPF